MIAFSPQPSLGDRVIDCVTGDAAIIEHVTDVPESRDLIGDVVPAHHRYLIRFDDGTYANRRVVDDLRLQYT